MAEDILLSPEEQDERARLWLKENAIYIVVGICLGIAAIFGVNKYKDDKLVGAEQASEIYATVVSKLSNSNIADIEAEVSQLKSDFSVSPYAAKVVLLNAKQYAEADELESAADELSWVIDNSKDSISIHAARLRLAKLHIYADDLSAAQDLLDVTETDGLDSHYSELKGDIATKKGQIDKAISHYRDAIDSAAQMSPQYLGLLENKISRLGLLAPAKPGE